MPALCSDETEGSGVLWYEIHLRLPVNEAVKPLGVDFLQLTLSIWTTRLVGSTGSFVFNRLRAPAARTSVVGRT